MTRIPRNLVLLGAVSFLTDASTEMVYPLLPAFIVLLGGGAVAVGLMEGTAETIASVLKFWSGRASDHWRRRKELALAGYGFSAVVKLGYPAAATVLHVVGLRGLDRLGKGIRGAPRDALIAESIARTRWGFAFGLHRAMDTLGAFAGPLLGLALVGVLSLRQLFLVATVPAFLAVALLLLVREAPPPSARPRRVPFPRDENLFSYLLVVAVFTLGNFAFLFLLLLGVERDLTTAQILLVQLVYTAAYAALAIPLGALTDRIGRPPLVAFSFVALIAASLYTAWADPATLGAFVGPAVAFGVAIAAFEGNGRALAADLAPEPARASVLGAYHAAIGLAALPGGLLMGLVWENVAPLAVFLVGALFVWAALMELLWLWGRGALAPKVHAPRG